MKRTNTLWLLVALLVGSLVIAACAGAPAAQAPAEETQAVEQPAASEEVVTIRYSLWDANQLPAYQQCADDFMAANPNIKIEISQTGWGDYWNDLQTSMVAGTAPDVFTNHLAKYPEFAAKGQLVDIQPFVERDGVDLSIYLGDLADLWARDGKRFGLPKDWDTISIVYNKDLLDAAGVTVEELNNATWNPEDGGTFGEIIARLSIDANGNNGLSPDFDPTNVVQYGYVIPYTDGGGAYGQTQWSYLAVSTGWNFIDHLYATEYHYDDPRFIATIDWYAGLIKKGFTVPFDESSSLGGQAIFEAGNKAALTSDGSWMIGEYANNTQGTVGFARLPIGPEGRKSMFNGLADSIWTGTKHVEEAWQWVKYLASPDCANTVGDFGVVFPAQQEAVNRALAAYQKRGLDVSAFTEQALEPNGTFLFPVTDHASEISSIMQETMQAIFLGQTSAAEALTQANAEVNALFQ
ncbi:MAG: sugar ABC transporter substrate-binding protein [Chloroflexi bacterium]|nr:MAG: sugar ABC transporter substrate-binding protein [Chloroflexota bacterium]